MHKVTINSEIDSECSGCHFLSINKYKTTTEQCGAAVDEISYEITCIRSGTAPCFKD